MEHLLVSHQLFTCDQILDELGEKLASPRLQKFIDPEVARHAVVRYSANAAKVKITNPARICRDPDDDAILALAATVPADCIVTGDNDLLVLDPFGKIEIVSPASFIARFSHSHD